MSQGPRYHDLLLEGAKTLGSEVSAAAQEWTGHAFNAEVLGAGVGRPAFRRNEKDLPTKVTAVRVDGTPLLIGEINGPPTTAVVADQLRRYRNQTVIARSWLGAEGPNLQLFLVGPVGALGHSAWHQLAATIEADDRICRKLVWLFDEMPALDSALQFLGRTFVATPWDKEERGQAQLDQMDELGLPESWQVVAEDEDLDPEGVVNRLIELEGDAE